MSKEFTTTFSLLDEVVKSAPTYATLSDQEAFDKAVIDLGVSLVMLLMLSDKEDVIESVNKTFEVAERIADKALSLGLQSNA